MTLYLVLAGAAIGLIAFAFLWSWLIYHAIVDGIYGGEEAYDEHVRRNAEIHEEWEEVHKRLESYYAKPIYDLTHWDEAPDPIEVFCGRYRIGRRPSWLRHPIIRHRMNKNLKRMEEK